MKQSFEILIVDRNPHVRELLKRELTAEGYPVRAAQSGREALKWVYYYNTLDLIIVDPDMPDIDQKILLQKLKNRVPAIPIILHAFLSDYPAHHDIFRSAIWVEKKENSIEEIKRLVADIQGASIY